MKNIFSHLPANILLRINIFSVIITAICEIFVVYTLLTKGADPDLERWKFLAIIGGVIIVSVLFLTSAITLVYFVRKMKKENSTRTKHNSL